MGRNEGRKRIKKMKETEKGLKMKDGKGLKRKEGRTEKDIKRPKRIEYILEGN